MFNVLTGFNYRWKNLNLKHLQPYLHAWFRRKLNYLIKTYSYVTRRYPSRSYRLLKSQLTTAHVVWLWPDGIEEIYRIAVTSQKNHLITLSGGRGCWNLRKSWINSPLVMLLNNLTTDIAKTEDFLDKQATATALRKIDNSSKQRSSHLGWWFMVCRSSFRYRTKNPNLHRFTVGESEADAKEKLQISAEINLCRG